MRNSVDLSNENKTDNLPVCNALQKCSEFENFQYFYLNDCMREGRKINGGEMGSEQPDSQK